MARKKQRLTILVSSTVYGIEELLEQVYAMLGGFGYEVWMSHKGTVPILPNQTALDSCLNAVEKCDLFLSIITPRYGSGVVDGQHSITHQELLKAIELDKPRWILAHDHVVFARTLLRKLGAKNQQQREEMLRMLGFDDQEKLRKLRNRKSWCSTTFASSTCTKRQSDMTSGSTRTGRETGCRNSRRTTK